MGDEKTMERVNGGRDEEGRRMKQDEGGKKRRGRRGEGRGIYRLV